MNVPPPEPGDTVFASRELRNDGSIPDLPENELIAASGTRGVLVNVGHFEEQPDVTLYLIRFENPDLSLGPAVGCWPDEIRAMDPAIDEANKG
ncbi:MAG: nitrogen fixation protein NifZ [Gammaproteobacteria bacterium]